MSLASELAKWVEYDPSSPTYLRWKVNVYTGEFSALLRAEGETAGGRGSRGYFQVRINTRLYRLHRVVWMLFNGDIPEGMEVDHEDLNKENNAIENLRLTTRTINARNLPKKRNNTSGMTGVGWTTSDGWLYCRAHWVGLDGKCKQKRFSVRQLGLLPAFASAAKYRLKMIQKLNLQGAGYTERHGT